jgi:hypothetical protein
MQVLPLTQQAPVGGCGQGLAQVPPLVHVLPTGQFAWVVTVQVPSVAQQAPGGSVVLYITVTEAMDE